MVRSCLPLAPRPAATGPDCLPHLAPGPSSERPARVWRSHCDALSPRRQRVCTSAAPRARFRRRGLLRPPRSSQRHHSGQSRLCARQPPRPGPAGGGPGPGQAGHRGHYPIWREGWFATRGLQGTRSVAGGQCSARTVLPHIERHVHAQQQPGRERLALAGHFCTSPDEAGLSVYTCAINATPHASDTDARRPWQKRLTRSPCLSTLLPVCLSMSKFPQIPF